MSGTKIGLISRKNNWNKSKCQIVVTFKCHLKNLSLQSTTLELKQTTNSTRLINKFQIPAVHMCMQTDVYQNFTLQCITVLWDI